MRIGSRHLDELIHVFVLVSPFSRSEEFLSMRPTLSRAPGPYVLLNLLPVLVVDLIPHQKSVVFVFSPSASWVLFFPASRKVCLLAWGTLKGKNSLLWRLCSEFEGLFRVSCLVSGSCRGLLLFPWHLLEVFQLRSRLLTYVLSDWERLCHVDSCIAIVKPWGLRVHFSVLSYF